MNTNLKGDISEAKICTALLEAGYQVVLPKSVRRWDIGWEDGDRLIRVQCKTGRVKGDVIVFNASSRGARKKQLNYRNQADFFAVYVHSMDTVYLIPVDLVGLNEGRLRLNPPKNGQHRGVHLAKDFEFPRPA